MSLTLRLAKAEHLLNTLLETGAAEALVLEAYELEKSLRKAVDRAQSDKYRNLGKKIARVVYPMVLRRRLPGIGHLAETN